MDIKTAKRVYKLSDIAISGGITIIGILLSLLVPSTLGLGICFIVTGLCVFPFLKTGYRIPGQKEVFHTRTTFFLSSASLTSQHT